MFLCFVFVGSVRDTVSILHMGFGERVDNILEELILQIYANISHVAVTKSPNGATALTRLVFSIGFVLLCKRP